MADKNSTSIIHAPRNAGLRREPKRANPSLEYETPMDDIKLPSVQASTLPRQLTLWRRGDPQRAKRRRAHALYIRDGNRFHRASSNQVLECANHVIAQRFRPGHPVLKSPERARAFLQYRMANRTHEVFAVLLLDQQHCLIKYLELFRGTINGINVHTREVVKEALAHGAVSVILAHNHPSGSTTPSLNDHSVTQQIKRAFAIFDIQVLDHLLVGKSVISFAEFGLL